MIELAQQPQQRMLLVVRERRQQVGDQRFLLRHHLLEQSLPAIGEEQAVRAALLAAGDQAILLHLVEQLRDIPLGHQQRIGQFLLRHPAGRPDLRQNVELGGVETMQAKESLRAGVDLLEHACQAQPGQQGGLAHGRSVCLSWHFHNDSLALNSYVVKLDGFHHFSD